jgi:hypothetical protein
MNTARIELEMRAALGLMPRPACRQISKPSRMVVRLSYRPAGGGNTRVYEHSANTISRLEVQLEAERIVRLLGGQAPVVLSIEGV